MESGNPKLPNSDESPTGNATVEMTTTQPVGEAKAESRIVVLAKREAGVRSTVNFLERRGFAAKYASSLNEAVEMFSKKEADKLLLSVNYPHPKVEMLPVLMNQSFKIETILFAEETDRKTSNRLSNAKTKHVLFGPVSGPVVMMKIRQIDRELSGETDETASSGEKRSLSSKEDEGDIKIGGRKSSDDDTVVLNGRSEKSSQATLENLMKSLSDEDGDSSSLDGLLRSGETYLQKGNRSKMKSAGGDDGSDGNSDGEENGTLSERAQALRAGLDRGLTAAPEVQGRKRLIAPNSFKRAASEADLSALEPFDDDSLSQDSLREDEVSPLTAVLSDVEKAALTVEEKIRRCLHESLAIVAGAPQSETYQLNAHAHAALVSLRTSQLNCAFVVSMNYAKQTANELFHRMEVAFFSLLRDYGVEFENSDTYSIFLDNMNIVREAFAGSEFAVITQTSDIEMGAAQVYVSDPVAKTDLYEGDMHSINLRDLPLDEPVTFNLFLHFKRNRKYLRYLKIGSTISDPQIHRLERHNVTGLVDHTEVEAFQRTFAAHAIVSLKKPAA